MRFLALSLGPLTLTLITSCNAQILAAPLRAGTLLQFNFDDANRWNNLAISPVGTIDFAGSTTPSGGLRSPGILSSGPLSLKNTEADLGKLTLALSLSASAARPVRVRVESFDQNKKRTGGLETVIYPAAPDFYQRYALDLNTFKPYGAGKFVATAPFLGFTTALRASDWKGVAKPELRLDNVHFAKPAFYVSANGNDKSDGRTEKTALKTPRRAVDLAGPGDIIAVMNGTYSHVGAQEGVVRFLKGGAPAAWISLKNYPGHKPLFSVIGTWNAIRIWRNAAQLAALTPAQSKAPAPSYIEVRGLHIRGEGDVAKAKYSALMLKAAPETNGNGISVGWEARPGEPVPHHLRFADNLVEFCPGAGIGPGQSDWVYIENNISRNNCWTTIYGTSGISLNHGSNFDGTSGGYRTLIRDNETSGNRTFEIWKQIGKVSDGNGIIVDVNQESKLPEEQRYNGRTLITNNVSFNNGGSGIHAFKSKRVDIINNTVFLNSASPELTWGQLFVQQSDDIRMINNIVVAPNDQPVNTVGEKPNDQNSTNIFRGSNLYFGGGFAPIMGEGDVIGDPLFVNPSIDPKVANFRLRAGSPALKAGRIEPFGPIRDFEGKARGEKPDIGAF